MKRIVCCGMAVLLLAINAFGQSPPPASPAPDADLQKVDDFRKLFEERELLLSQRDTANQQVWDLWSKLQNLPGLEVLERDLERLKQDLDRARKAARPAQELDSMQRQVTAATVNVDVVRDAGPKYETARNEFEKKSRRLLQVEQRIASLFDASRDVNRFRTYVTVTFGILVLFVIAGFYIIAWNKEGVAATIFSGEMGMQFVTLFLIVIAIILFGIMGTLEGRELAALLGGLSGYILGRATSQKLAKDGGQGGGGS